MGKCALCRHKATTHRNTITRLVFGEEFPIPLCASHDDSLTDLELVLELVPESKHRLAKRHIYGTAAISPIKPDRFYSPVCVSDIRPKKLNWSAYKSHR